MPLPFEKSIIHAITKAFHCKRQKDKKVILQTLLNTLLEGQNDPVQQQVFNFFNIPRWLESKTKGIPYKDLVHQQVTAENT